MIQLYNIALLPIDPKVAENLINQARENFLEDYDGYILGSDALPHITLCHFYSYERELASIWNLVVKEFISEYLIEFDGLYLNAGKDQDMGYIWAGLSTRRNTKIINLQARICALLLEHNCVPLTQSVESYFPHLTFARLKAIRRLKYPDQNIFIKPYIFKGSIGLSNNMGVYKKVIYV